MQLQLQLPLCPRSCRRRGLRQEFGQTSLAAGNCGIICSGRARQSRSCLFHSHRPTPCIESFFHLSLDTSSHRHIATNQTDILQSISHSSSTAHQSHLAFATSPGAPARIIFPGHTASCYMVCSRFLCRNQMHFARVAS
jgi:hypothetical protein